MKSMLSFFAVIYLVSLVWAIPALIYFTWGLFFFPELPLQSTIRSVGALSVWIVCGGIAANLLAKHRVKKIRAAAKSVTPPDFVSRFEIFDIGADRYLTISPSTGQLIIVDLMRKIARCEPISFVTSYDLEDGRSQAVLTIRLADFDFSTIEFRFGNRHRHDISSRLALALR